MIIIKDVLIHFPNKNIQYLINHILPNFKYALITNDFSSTNNNVEIQKGQFRTVDLAAPPFNVTNLQVILDYDSHNVKKRVYLYTNPNPPTHR